MKRIFTLILLVFSISALQAQEIQWMSMNEALAAQKKQPKKIFMDAYTLWCGPCKMLDKNTFTNPDVIDYINKNFYPVKFNAEGNEEVTYKNKKFSNPGFDENRKGRNSTHEFTRALKVTGYPSLVFFDEEANLIGPIPGYRTPKQLEIYLKLFSGEDYKKITSQEAWKDYESKFESTFK
ncbi:thioredoxin family protein [Salegentibacter sp. HM20]